jgi:prefoldin subunit 5
MTGEEMERAIEFLLQRQATLEERIEQVNRNLSEQIAETDRSLGKRIDDLSATVQMLATSQSQFNQTLTATITALADSQQRLADSQQHTDRKLDALIDIVRERLEGRGGG